MKIPISKSFKRAKKRKHFGFQIFTLGCILFILYLLLDMQFRPVLKTISAYQAKSYAVTLINEAVSEQTARDQVNYNTLSTIERSEDGSVSSVEVNTQAINQIHTAITSSVTQALNESRHHIVKIPIGNLTGIPLLSNWGPALSIDLIPKGYVHTQIISQFQASGINQTIHQITLRIAVNIATIVPLHSSNVEISMDYMLAETIIVGTVPQYYTKVISDAETPLDQANSQSNSQRLWNHETSFS